jgi:putative ABC transport system permease protein
MHEERSAFRRIASFVFRSKNRGDEIRQDIDAELKSHLEMRIQDNIAQGMSPEEARRDAYSRFGNRAAINDRVAIENASLWWEQLWRDVRLACRVLRKSPGFTITAIVTLALGIGANTATFTVVDAVMLRPLPYRSPEQLVDLVPMNSRFPQDHSHNLSYPDYFDYRAANHSLTHLVSYHDTSYTMTGLGVPVHVDAQIVSWDLLPVLGVQPELGRGFLPEEEKPATRVVLISHALWMSQFAKDPTIVGRSIRLNDQQFTVIGVMPASFRFPMTSPENGLWTPLAADKEPGNSSTTNRGMHFLNAIGRLKPGITAAQANQDFGTIASALARQYPASNTRNDSAKVRSELSALLGDTHAELEIALTAVGLVLLVVCGNIVNLLLARLRDRQREIAMRSALGAGRGRIVRQLLVESLVLSTAGGVAGCFLAFAFCPALLYLIGDSIPRAQDAHVDLRVLLFAVAISCLAGLIFGVFPAISATKISLLSLLKDGAPTETGGRDWLRPTLIVGQVALGVLLAAAAGALIATFLHLRRVDEGFTPDHLLTLLFETPDSRYKDTRPEFYRQYFEKVRAIPGVSAAAGAMIMPMTQDGADIGFEDPEHPAPEGQSLSANVTLITEKYFKTMQIPLLRGRDFSDGDGPRSQPVMIVDDAFARKFFPGENVLGKRIKPGASNGSRDQVQWREIIGVVGNVRLSVTQPEMRPEMYLPSAQLGHWCCLHTVIRTSVEPRSVEPGVRQVVASMDRDIPVTNVRTMQELMSLEMSQPRFAMVLLGIFAALGVSLTVVGLYGVMSYSVSRRTREIGIRMALGAHRVHVLNRVMREAAVMLGLGIILGMLASLLSASAIKSMLYGTKALNPLLLVVVSAFAAITGMIAAFIPARRAASIDPMQALRD